MNLIAQDANADHGGEVVEVIGRTLDLEIGVEIVEFVDADAAEGSGKSGAVGVGKTLGFGGEA